MFEVGQVVVAQSGFVLHCGTGRYSHAIVAQADPLVLVSEDGSMRWSNLTASDVYPLCQAHPDIVAVSLRRLASDKKHGQL